MKAYLISGLGADERVFENLKLKNNISIHYVQWIKPLKKESFQHYIIRLMVQINTSEPFILIGMSLGGIVAVEMNKLCKPNRTIIISSVSTSKEYSILFRIIRIFSLQKITPTFLLKTPGPIAYWFFGIKSRTEKNLLKSFMKNVSSTYLKWAVNQVIKWKNSYRPPELIHIHGTKDKIFPYSKTNADYLINNGGHFMVHNKAEEINTIINQFI